MTTKTPYQVACEAHDKAVAAYNEAAASFRYGGSVEAFKAAQAEKEMADAAFDAVRRPSK